MTERKTLLTYGQAVGAHQNAKGLKKAIKKGEVVVKNVKDSSGKTRKLYEMFSMTGQPHKLIEIIYKLIEIIYKPIYCDNLYT